MMRLAPRLPKARSGAPIGGSAHLECEPQGCYRANYAVADACPRACLPRYRHIHVVEAMLEVHGGLLSGFRSSNSWGDLLSATVHIVDDNPSFRSSTGRLLQ